LKYKFRKKLKDPDIEQLVREIEDNLADQKDVDDKQKKVTGVGASIPNLTELKDGEKKIYYDGTNRWKYERYGGELFKTQMTKVV